MLNKEVLQWWVGCGVAFANQPDSASDADSEVFFRLRLVGLFDPLDDDWDDMYVPPAAGYKKLRAEWRKFLAKDKNSLKFREWCQKNTADLDGRTLYRYEKLSAHGYEDCAARWPKLIPAPAGRQCTFVNRPEALLAHAGFALLSDKPPARVARCKCGSFFAMFGAGKPSHWCATCRDTKKRPSDLSTIRVRKHRGAKK